MTVTWKRKKIRQRHESKYKKYTRKMKMKMNVLKQRAHKRNDDEQLQGGAQRACDALVVHAHESDAHSF